MFTQNRGEMWLICLRKINMASFSTCSTSAAEEKQPSLGDRQHTTISRIKNKLQWQAVIEFPAPPTTKPSMILLMLACFSESNVKFVSL